MDHTRTELRLEGNPRLLVAVAPVILHAAQRVGLAAPVGEAFELATEEICKQALALINGCDPFLHVTVEDFEDRIEVTVEHSGKPHVGSLMDLLRTNVSAAGSASTGVPGACQVDDIRCVNDGNNYRVRLVKFSNGSHSR